MLLNQPYGYIPNVKNGYVVIVPTLHNIHAIYIYIYIYSLAHIGFSICLITYFFFGSLTSEETFFTDFSNYLHPRPLSNQPTNQKYENLQHLLVRLENHFCYLKKNTAEYQTTAAFNSLLDVYCSFLKFPCPIITPTFF